MNTKEEIKNFIKTLLDATVEFLKSNGKIMPMVIVFLESGKTEMLFLPDGLPKEDLRTYLLAIGSEIRSKFDDLSMLLMLTDTFLLKSDLTNLKIDELEIVDKAKRGEIRLSDFPKKYKHLRTDALSVISRDIDDKVEVLVLPYSYDKKVLKLGNEEHFEDVEDNLVRTIWQGYFFPRS